MKNYGKIFKIMMVALILVSIALLVWGFAANFGEGVGDKPVDMLLLWTYIMLGIVMFAVVVVGLVISAVNNPKSLIKLLCTLVGVGAVCLLFYAIAPGDPAVGLTIDQPSTVQLKFTDTILYLTYFAGAATILSIVIGEIVMAIRNK